MKHAACRNALLGLKVTASVLNAMAHAILGLLCPLLESEDVQWGLYKWCSVEEGKTTQCHQIHPGESPAYVEVARFSAAFSVVMIFLSIPIVLWMPADKSTCKWLLKMVLTWLPSLNVGTTLVLVGAYYKDDDRWKDSTPSVTVFFSGIAFFAALDFLPTCFFFLLYSCGLIELISDQHLGRLRQGRHPRPTPNAEPFSNQGEKNQTSHCQRLNSAKMKANILWKQLCRKLVTAMKRLKDNICSKRLSRKPVMTTESLMASSSGKHLSRKLVFSMKRLGPGTVQDIPDNPLRHQPGQPEGHGSPPIRHAPGGPAGDLPPGIVQNDASDTCSVRAGHSEGAARYNAADAYRSGDTTIHQIAGQDDVSRYTTMDSVIHQTAGQGEVSRYTTMDSVIPQGAPPERPGHSATMDPVIGQGGQGSQEELSRSHSASDAPRVHLICRPQLTLIFHLRRPGHTGADPPTSSYI